jgi:hypothetical protein
MLVDAKTEAARNQAISILGLALLMALPVIGQLSAAIVLIVLVTQVLSKSADRTKDLGFLLCAAILYIFALFVAVLGANGLRGIPLLYLIPQWLFVLAAIAMVVWGRGIVRPLGAIGLALSLSVLLEGLWGPTASVVIRMGILLFAVSYWALSRMKVFLFAR